MTEHKPAKFWTEVRTGIKGDGESILQRRLLEEKVLKYLQRVHPQIYIGAPQAHFATKDADNLFRQLKRKANAQEYLIIINFLIKGLDAGKNILGWPNVVVPSKPILARREPSRFTPLSFKTLNSLKPVHTAFTEFLETLPDDNSTQHLGSILLSAILYGGLLDKKWLTPLLRGLADRVTINGSLMWIEMQRPYIYAKHKGHNEKRKYINRRWFPDPLTQALIIRLHANFHHQLAACSRLDALTCVKFVMRRLFKSDDHPSIKNLFRGAECYLALRIPGLFVSYATGKTKSVSLPAHTWTRLLTDKSVTPPLSTDEDEDEDDDEYVTYAQRAEIDSQDSYDMYKQERLRKQLTGILGEARRSRTSSTSTRTKVSDFMNEHTEEMVPALQMLGQWAIELLTKLPVAFKGRKGRSPLQPSSVATYLQAIDQELIACAGHYNISLYEPEEFIDLYEDVIKATEIKHQNTMAGFLLTQFHRFLIRAYDSPEIDMSSMTGSKGPPENGVDANLISPSIYCSVLYSLGWELPKRSRLQTIQCLITILGFRCGLRRHEAFCLRIGDLMGEALPEIIIRTNYINRLKTRDSARRIPIRLLLEPREFDILLEWKHARIAEENQADFLNAPLFGMPGGRDLSNEKEVFDPITDALRKLTGDVKSRYHHLRHSFANRMLLVLMSDSLTSYFQSKSIKDFYSYHISTHDLKTGLFGNMNLGRQYLHGIATLLGHASLTTTLLKYIHLCDWLLGQMVQEPFVQPAISLKAIMQITGLKRATVFRKKATSNQESWQLGAYLERLTRHSAELFPDRLAASAREIAPDPPITIEVIKPLPNWKFIQYALKQHQEYGMQFDHIADRLKVSIQLIDGWCTTAITIRDLTTKEGTLRHLTAWQRKCKDDKGQINLFPALPDYPADKKIVNKILKRVAKLSLPELEIVRTGCQIFINRYSSNQGYARFTEFKGAVAFKEFLQLVGVPDSMIYVSMFTKNSPRRPKEHEEHRIVLKKLGIAEDHMLSSGKRHVRYRRTHECSVGFMVVRTDRTIIRKSKQVTAETLYGFRYAIYLLAIGLGFEQCSQG